MPPLSSLIDIDRAESAFRLLFLFVRDEMSEEDERSVFSGALKELLRGLQLPPGAVEKLHRIFNVVVQTPPDLERSVDDVLRDFGPDREALVAIVRLILRLVSDEGMISRRHCSDLRLVLDRFALTLSEYELFSEEEKQLLSFALSGEGFAEWGTHSKEMLSAYSTLGCPPNSTDDEIRRAYRSLAKKYHPDRAAPLDLSESETKSRQRQFQKVQSAYDHIVRGRTEVQEPTSSRRRSGK